MRTPESLTALVDHGIIDEVVRPLMSGKEAHVYLVLSGGEQRVAKIYKEAQNRSFQNRADYTEGRKVRNSRDQRAMGRGSRHGKAQNEAAWKSAEVDMIYRLRDAGVRVPNPHHFIDGVLIMELVVDGEGFPAPRLGDLVWEPTDAGALFKQLLVEVVRMLSIGVVHGDLSDFNVLMSATGPVLIDFPQSVDAATNTNARKLLLRDVENLNRFAAKFDPTHSPLPYGEEMWELYKRNALTPETQLTGRFKGAQKAANTTAVLNLISDANKDERRRREARGISMRGTSQETNEPFAAGPTTRDERPAREPSALGRAGAAPFDGPRRGHGGREPRFAAPQGGPPNLDATGPRATARPDLRGAARNRDGRAPVAREPRAGGQDPAARAAGPDRYARGAEGRETRVAGSERAPQPASRDGRAARPERERVPAASRDERGPVHDRDARAPGFDRDARAGQPRSRAEPSARPAARNFDVRPPLGERASRPHTREREPHDREARPAGQERELRAQRDDRSARAPALARDPGPVPSGRDERAISARTPERARDERSRDERRSTEGDARRAPDTQPRAAGQAVSRHAERRVGSFGERVPYRGQHADAGPRGPGVGAQRPHEQSSPDRSSEFPKRPR